MTINQLDAAIRRLHKAGAIHKRRGLKLSDVTPASSTNHLLEEAVELQAECLFGNYPSMRDEAADVLGAFLHLLWVNGIPLDVVVDVAARKLAENFTTDPAEVTAVEPGLTRRGRR